jgi:hypothetical protein
MWIQSHQSLARHWKTLRLVRLLGVSKSAAIGNLHLLWWWCLDYADDGYLGRFRADEIALAAEFDGDPEVFVQALVESGFIDMKEDGLHIHDWAEYTGRLKQRRDANTQRMRDARAQHVQRTDSERVAHVQRTDGAHDAHDSARASDVRGQSREEEKREEEKRGDMGAVAPAKVTPIEKGKRGMNAPKHFDLDAEHYDAAEALGFTTQQTVDETARFLDWHRAKGTTHVDWTAAWRNWMRKARDLKAERGQSKSDAEYWAEFDRLTGGGDVEVGR